MVFYFCDCCLKTFNRKSSYTYHTENKKNKCSPDDNKPENIDELQKTTDNTLEIINELLEKCKNEIETLNNENTFEIMADENGKFKCNLCFMDFTRKDNLKTHKLKYCKVKKQLENQKEMLIEEKEQRIRELEQQNKEYLEQQKKFGEVVSMFRQGQFKKMPLELLNLEKLQVIPSIGFEKSVSDDEVVQKIEFGKEDLSKLSDNFFLKTLMNSFGAEIPQKIIEGIHFNPNLKENMNVYIADSSRNKAMIYDGKKWKVSTANEVVENLLDKAVSFCEDRHDELKEKIKDNEKQTKKINKEMDTIKIMTNYEPYDYNYEGQPLDIDGIVRTPEDFIRGKKLNERAKNLITLSLQNNKNLVLENSKNIIQKRKFLKTNIFL